MPIARNHIALDVNFPSSPRLEHPLTAGAQRPYRKSTSNGGSGGSLLPLPAQLQRGSSSSSNGSSNLHVFDFNSLPADKGPRTPRHPAVTPLNVRRQAKARTPLQQPAMHLPGGEGGPSYPNIPSASSSPSPPPSFPLGGGNLVSLSQLGDAPPPRLAKGGGAPQLAEGTAAGDATPDPLPGDALATLAVRRRAGSIAHAIGPQYRLHARRRPGRCVALPPPGAYLGLDAYAVSSRKSLKAAPDEGVLVPALLLS